MRAAPPGGRRASGLGKFRGDKLVDEVTHNPRGRTNAEQALYELADPVAAAEERELWERQLALERAEEERKLEIAREEQLQVEQLRQQVEATKIRKAQEQEQEQEREVLLQKEQANKEKEQQRQEEKTLLERQRLLKAEEDRRRAEAERVVDARLAKERREEEEAKQAARAEEEERLATQELAARISEEKARREQLRAEEAARAAAEEEEDRLAAQREAAQQAEATRAALAAANEEESAELRQKRLLAEEKRRKRAAFLADNDEFSSDFAVHNDNLAEQRKALLGQTDKVLADSLATQAQGFVAVKSTYVPQEKSPTGPNTQTVFQRPPLPAASAATQQAARTQDETEENDNEKEKVVKLSNSASETFGTTASTLFASAKATDAADAQTNNAAATATAYLDDAPLRMPTRVGRGDAAKMSGKATPLVESSSIALKPSLPVKHIGATRTESVVPALNKYEPKKAEQSGAKKNAKVDEYNEEEGMGEDSSISNVLTKEERAALTSEQKEVWKAKQEDLGKRRKGYHGAVTYAFDGIFSWEMYGSAEAIDEGGNTYTEYLMRCQWGTSWENLQPWISARRYREFDALDAELKRAFPNYERAMPQLPGKDFFRFLEADVIDKRRQTLENYMSRVVLHLPSILRSRQLSDFLGIQERLVTIKKQLASSQSKGLAKVPSGQSPDVAVVLEPPRTASASASAGGDSPRTSAPASASASASASAGGSGSGTSRGFSDASDEPDARGDAPFIKTVEEAEQRRKDIGYEPFDEEQLSTFEEELQKLILGLQGHASTKRIKKTSAGYKNLVRLSSLWPQLRATCQVDSSAKALSCSLIPRALQAEEDLIRLIRDFESLTATADHLAVLGI